MQNHHASYQLKRARERSLAYLVLFVVMLFFGLAGTILAIMFVPHPSLLFSRGEVGQQSDAVVNVSLEDLSFNIPEPVIADVQKTLLGRTTRIDLKWPWPLARQELTTIRELPSDINDWLVVTLEPREGRTGLEERFGPIYSNFFKPETAQEQGLTRYSFTEEFDLRGIGIAGVKGRQGDPLRQAPFGSGACHLRAAAALFRQGDGAHPLCTKACGRMAGYGNHRSHTAGAIRRHRQQLSKLSRGRSRGWPSRSGRTIRRPPRPSR